MAKLGRASRLATAAVMAAAFLLTVSGSPALAADPSYVKYYTVAGSFQGKPETLPAIADRLLADAARSTEIFNLNVGRVQPDGAALTDPAQLHPGWYLVLPWDAYGQGVQYGLLPTSAPTPTKPPAAKSTPAKPPAAPAPPPAGQAGACAPIGQRPDGTHDQWGALRVAADLAWPYSRGAGVLVAVVDSGVDASLPAFAGRVTVGSNIIDGTGRGDTDCLGTGTAIASIIAAGNDSGMSGVAPEATILPVRVLTTDAVARPADQATAIAFAVMAGARVIALGAGVTPADPAAEAALAEAASHGIVVVRPADRPAAASSPTAAAAAAVLRVGAISIDGAVSGTYPANGVDVLAPGVGVAVLGLKGSGTVEVTGAQYAAAYVAGVVALVQARFPKLSAAQVVHRIKVTADSAEGTATRAGLINPAAAVTRYLPEENGPTPLPAPVPDGPHPFRVAGLVIAGLLALTTAIALVLRLRRLIQPDEPDGPHGPDVVRPMPADTGRPVVTHARVDESTADTRPDDLDLADIDPTYRGSRTVLANGAGVDGLGLGGFGVRRVHEGAATTGGVRDLTRPASARRPDRRERRPRSTGLDVDPWPEPGEPDPIHSGHSGDRGGGRDEPR